MRLNDLNGKINTNGGKMKLKVQAITQTDCHELTKSVNGFLEENPLIEVVDIKLSECQTTMSALIIYKT